MKSTFTLISASWRILVVTVLLAPPTTPLSVPSEESTSPRETESEAFDTLRFVQVVFRHGARTPVVIFEGDANNAYWKEGLGQLTKEGIEREYELGVWLGNRYRKFLGTNVKNNTFYIRSTDKDRTLASAQLVAAGAFPPVDHDKWNDKLGQLWQPVPIHTIAKNTDPFTDNYAMDFCQRYVQLMSLLPKTPVGKNVLSKNSDIAQIVFNATGQDMKDFKNFLDPCDTYLMEKINNLQLPFDDSIRDRLMALCDYFEFYYIKTSDMVRLAGGYQIREIVGRFSDAAEENLGNMKAYFYSAHDYTSMFIQATLGVFNNINPPFTSALVLEMHEQPKGHFFVKILYRNDTSREPYTLQMPDCAEECPLEDVVNITQRYFIDDIEAACQPFTPEELVKKQAEYDNDLQQ